MGVAAFRVWGMRVAAAGTLVARSSAAAVAALLLLLLLAVRVVLCFAGSGAAAAPPQFGLDFVPSVHHFDCGGNGDKCCGLSGSICWLLDSSWCCGRVFGK